MDNLDDVAREIASSLDMGYLDGYINLLRDEPLGLARRLLETIGMTLEDLDGEGARG